MKSKVDKLFLKLQKAKTDEEREVIKKQIDFVKKQNTVLK